VRLLSPFVPRRIKQSLTQLANLQDRVRDLEKEIEVLRTELERHRAVVAQVPARAPGHSILNEFERKVYSQNGEDGILEFIFARIGTTNRTFVEFGIQDGRECNTANLSLRHGWSGLLMEADEEFADRAREFYRGELGANADRVRIRRELVTTENIDRLLEDEGITGVIDLLSIDIDGSDLWVWEAISAIQPRVVVIEYNASFGPSLSVTTPYDAAFARFDKHPSGIYHGASLTALAKSARKRGYWLVGCESRGVNAFFVSETTETGSGLGEISPAIAFYPQDRRSVLSPEEQLEIVCSLDVIEV